MTSSTHSTHACLEAGDWQRAVHLTMDLLSLASANPPGDETAVSDYLFNYFSELGYAPVRQFCQGNRCNILLTIRGDGSCSKTVAYIGHLDVVPPGDLSAWTSHPFKPDIRAERLYGRGAADMKGSLACAIYFAELLAKTGHKLGGDLLYVLDVDEEHTNMGIRRFLDDPPALDFALVGEPTGLDLALGHRGVMALTVTLTGRSAHAGQADRGINAIHCATELISAVRDLNTRLGGRSFPHIGSASMHATLVNGGTKVNTIPESCEVQFDRRLLPGEDPATCKAELQPILTALEKKLGCQTELAVTTYCPCGLVDEKRPEVGTICRSMRTVLKREPVIRSFEATCEAGIIMERLGIPAVILGPGHISQAHNTDEYVALEQLRSGAQLYATILTDLLSKPDGGAL